jgi:hypothetical protein
MPRVLAARDVVWLVGPAIGAQPAQDDIGRITGAQTLGRAKPAPEGQQGQRDEVEQIGHDRAPDLSRTRLDQIRKEIEAAAPAKCAGPDLRTSL